MDPMLRNVLLLGLGFFFVMGGYSPCQNFASTLLNLPCLAVGDISIGIIYLMLSMSAVCASAVIRRTGEKKVLVYCSAVYALYVLSVSYIVSPVVFVTSVVLGLCGGLLNTAGGAMLAKNSDDSNRGLHSGIYNAFQQGAALPGSAAAAFYFGSSTLDELTSAAATHCADGTTWKDRIVIGWDGSVSVYFCGLAVMCDFSAPCFFFH